MRKLFECLSVPLGIICGLILFVFVVALLALTSFTSCTVNMIQQASDEGDVSVEEGSRTAENSDFEVEQVEGDVKDSPIDKSRKKSPAHKIGERVVDKTDINISPK